MCIYVNPNLPIHPTPRTDYLLSTSSMTQAYNEEKGLIPQPAALHLASLNKTLCPVKLAQCLSTWACSLRGRTPIPRGSPSLLAAGKMEREDSSTGQQTRTPMLVPSTSGWKVAQLGPLRDRHLSAFLCEGVSGDLSECQLFYGKGSQSQKKPAIQSRWKYNIEAFSWNATIYSCHTTLSKWNHILCQTSKDIITWKLFLLPWCMVISSSPQM